MKKITTIILILIFSMLCLFGLTSCKDKDEGLIRLNEVTHSVFYAPLYVAINKGYFAEEGLTIELTNGGGSDKSMTAVISGQADIGLMGPETAVYVNLQGSKNYPVVFGQLTKCDGSFLMGRTAQPNFKWSDLAGKEILGGRKGGMPAMCLEYALVKNNLINGTNVTINYDVQFDLLTAAFESGVADYCTMFEPAASQYQASGKGYIISSIGAEAGAVPYTCFMATKEYIGTNKEKVTKFMKAIIKAVNFVILSTDAEVAQALSASFPTTSLEMLESSVKSYRAIDAFMTNPIMTESSFIRLIDILIASKSIDERPSFSDIIDNSIAQKILEEQQ